MPSIHDYTSQESLLSLRWETVVSFFDMTYCLCFPQRGSQWETRPLSCGGGVKFPRMQWSEKGSATSQVWWWQAGMTSPTTAMRYHRNMNNIFVDVRNKSDQKACNSQLSWDIITVSDDQVLPLTLCKPDTTTVTHESTQTDSKDIQQKRYNSFEHKNSINEHSFEWSWVHFLHQLQQRNV